MMFENASDSTKIGANWIKYFQEASQEFYSMTSSVLDFTKTDIQYGVKSAFFGLEAFHHRARFHTALFNNLQEALFDMVLRVGLLD